MLGKKRPGSLPAFQKRGVRPKRIVRGMQRRYAAAAFFKKRHLTALGLTGGTVMAAQGVAVNFANRPRVGIPLVLAGTGIALATAFATSMARKALTKNEASIIGRPALARAIARKEKDPNQKKGLIFLGNLPFVGKEEVLKYLKAVGKNADLAGLGKFRCFSRQEIEKLRSDLRNTDDLPKMKAASKRVMEFAREKAQIMAIAIEEPELVSIFFREIAGPEGIPGNRELNSEKRMAAVETIRAISGISVGEAFGGIGRNVETGKTTHFSLEKLGKGKWRFRKIVS
jgi:hypothetical protein